MGNSLTQRSSGAVTRSQTSLFGSEWVGLYKYPSHGHRYYRIQWGTGRKVQGQMHLPGGDIHSPIAQARAQAVRGAIARGDSLAELQVLIGKWRAGRHK